MVVVVVVVAVAVAVVVVVAAAAAAAGSDGAGGRRLVRLLRVAIGVVRMSLVVILTLVAVSRTVKTGGIREITAEEAILIPETLQNENLPPR